MRRSAPACLRAPPRPAVDVAAAPTASPPLSEEETFARKTLEELNAERPLDDVFFDFDDSQVGDEGRTSLQKNAEWLRRWTSTRVAIEGHCDARGTNEYNLALGDRRAIAARNYLTSLGIAADRVVVVSKGEESPFCAGEGEDCWRQNRRGHFVVIAK